MSPACGSAEVYSPSVLSRKHRLIRYQQVSGSIPLVRSSPSSRQLSVSELSIGRRYEEFLH